ncbi:hypothetical protein OKW50_000163 [Paraburkholderia youngii]|uniref:Uncharacterized protein n=1 Tax=Paraburkholderia youngii TaxID=2782701 RepID=A0A7W8L5V9_9BURK|nr:hypothetical protein [Paraburkholderia youngii]
MRALLDFLAERFAQVSDQPASPLGLPLEQPMSA